MGSYISRSDFNDEFKSQHGYHVKPGYHVEHGYHIEHDANNGDPLIFLCFWFNYTGIEVRVCFEDPCFVKKQKWIDFTARNQDKLTFCNSNGIVEMRWSEDNIVLEVGKYGAGGDGTITITVCKENVPEFKNSLEHIIADPVMNNNWH